MSRSIWATLGIKATNDTAEIRRAYARRLKAVHPEDDPDGFQALRAAYDQASNMASNGWAVPRPLPEESGNDSEDGVDDDDWDHGAPDRWNVAPGTFDDFRGWDTPAEDRWTQTDAVAPQPIADDAGPGWDPQAERARANEQAAAHQALCDQLSTIVRDSAGDREEALSILIRIFRSPGMDSLQVHGRTERWLAQLVGFGGPAAEGLVEPVIQYFGWNTSRIGIDLSHAQPVLRRREAADLIRRLESGGERDHDAWQALKSKPDWSRRALERLTPGLLARVSVLLDRITWDLPELQARMDPAAAALWRDRLSKPILSPVFLWVVLLAGPIVAMGGNGNGAFGPPDGRVFLALWTLVTFGLLGFGLAYLHGVARPRRAWTSNDPWGQPLWLRLGWAPAALAVPLLGGILLPGWWVAALLLPIGLGLWGWARVTTGHMTPPADSRFDWSRFAGIAPIFGFLLFQTNLVGPYGLGLTMGLVAASLVLQTGADAVADERAHQPKQERIIAGGELAAVALGVAAVLAAAATGVGLPQATGLVAAIAVADRALSWNRAGPLLAARRVVLMFGWIGAFMVATLLPYDGFEMDAFVALGLWLLLAAAMNAVHTLVGDLGLFAGAGAGARRRKRKPGELT